MDLIDHNKVIPAVNQIEPHPFCQQIDAYKFLQEHKVQIESWGPLAEGRNYIPENARKLPLVLWHGYGQSSKTWETTPDRREGYQNIFLQHGFRVYVISNLLIYR